MLLKSLFKDSEGRLKGVSEIEGIIELSLPHACAILGEGDYSKNSSSRNFGVSLLQSDLENRAREDSSRYYFIQEPIFSSQEDACVIPYLSFEKFSGSGESETQDRGLKD